MCGVIQAVRLRNRVIDQLIERIRDAVVVAEAQTGRIVVWNAAATRIFGYSSSEVLGHSWTVIVPERLKAQCEAGMARYRDTGHGPYIDSNTVLELPAVRKDKEEITIEIVLSPMEPIRDLEGTEGRLVFAIIRDVTEREEVKKVLRESEERYRSLVQHTSDTITVLDAGGTIIYVSPAVERMTGYKPEERVGTNAFNSVHPDDRERASGIFAEILKTPGIHLPLEFRVQHRDGSWRYLEHTVNNLLDDPAMGAVVINSRDITERKRAEAEIRRLNEDLEARVAERTIQLESALAELEQRERRLLQSEWQLRQLFENSADALFVHDEHGRIVDCNAQACRALGYTREELLELSVADLATHLISEEERREKKGRTLWERARRGAPGRMVGFEENELRRKDGTTFPVEVGVGALEYKGRRLIFASVRDTTERKLAEAALKESEERYRAVVEQAAEGILLVDVDTKRVLETNAAYQDLLGYSTEEALRLSLYELVPYSREDMDCYVERVLESGSYVSGQRRHLRKDGSLVDVEVSANVVYYGGREIICMVVRDITERKRAEEDLRRLNEELEGRVRWRTAQLEAFNNELEAFSYSVSHDLRAPLRAIDGFSQILLEDYEDKLDEEGRLYLRRTKNASQRMGHLIDDLLNLSRMTRSEMRRESVDLSALVEGVVEDLRATSPEHEVDVIVEEGLVVNGDESLLRVALENLLGNAWKFTRDRTRPRIEFGTLEHEDTPAYFVRDNGVGFDMAYADKLFGAFQRLHSTGEFEGTGIGLATVQRIIHRHGGRVWAEGNIGSGATFFFTL
ncbi:MAG TPA: PAS domain S-box protein [Rubrobacteraceae bacterium]|nr:PAS domain S-box protein [Rubrobacteraceae bacterium]